MRVTRSSASRRRASPVRVEDNLVEFWIPVKSYEPAAIVENRTGEVVLDDRPPEAWCVAPRRSIGARFHQRDMVGDVSRD